MLRAISSLMSLQILGRYMNAPAWSTVMTPQKMYFLSSGLQIAHNFWYSLSSLTFCCENWQETGLSKNLNIKFQIRYIYNSPASLIPQVKHLQQIIQLQQLFSMNKFVLFCTLFSLAIPINFRCTPPSSSILMLYDDLPDELCPANSHCLENGFCDCDLGFIGGCSQNASRLKDGVEFTSEISSQAYTFFQIIGSTQTYTLLSFNLCRQEKSGTSDFNIDVWDDNGTIDLLTKQNAEIGGKVWTLNENCLVLNTPFMLFGTKTNGETEGFILGLKKTRVGTEFLGITVQVTELDFWGMMVKILFILGSCFLLVLSSAIIYVVYKWRRRQLFFTNQTREKDISHLDAYMPKIKLQEMENKHIASEICSICLLEFGETQYLRKTVCIHIFHQDCLDSWCKTHLSCPVCRRSFQKQDLLNEAQTIDQTDSQRLREGIL